MATSNGRDDFKFISWNINRSSTDRLDSQLDALNEREPDIIALQEFGVKAGRNPRKQLREQGFNYVAHSHEFRLCQFDSASGVVFGSKWPFRVLDPGRFEMPYDHHFISAEFYTPFGRIEGHNIHIMPGSQVEEEKVEMFEGLYDGLTTKNQPAYRLLAGDFNSPKAEDKDGTVTVWGRSPRWKTAERNVICGLAEYDLTDVYRELNGYENEAYSYETNASKFRFDHVFASEKLNAVEANYLHQFDDLSDHTPLEVVFEPVVK